MDESCLSQTCHMNLLLITWNIGNQHIQKEEGINISFFSRNPYSMLQQYGLNK